MIASLPGGLAGLAHVIDELHASGVKVLWPVRAAHVLVWCMVTAVQGTMSLSCLSCQSRLR